MNTNNDLIMSHMISQIGKENRINIANARYEEQQELMPWEREDFVPLMPSGKQRSPNMIRAELQKYIDSSTETQTAIVQRMGVNNNSFRRFMNPKTYKNQWSATDNGTYWAAARLLEQHRYEKKQAAKAARKQKAGNKRSSTEAAASATFITANSSAKSVLGETSTSTSTSNKRTKVQDSKQAVQKYMGDINAVTLPQYLMNAYSNQIMVYDSCPELVKKIKTFLSTPGLTKKDFCIALGDINQNSLNSFLLGKKQDQCGNITYRRGYEFFEKKRILDQKPKSKQRLKSEQEFPMGYSLVKERAGRWVIGGFF